MTIKSPGASLSFEHGSDNGAGPKLHFHLPHRFSGHVDFFDSPMAKALGEKHKELRELQAEQEK